MNALAELRDDYAAGKDWLLGTSTPVNRHARRAVQAQRVKTAARSEADVARDTARRIGSVVWTATDPADFADILDAEANDLPASQLARRVAATLYAGRFVRVADPQMFLRSVCARVSSRPKTRRTIQDGKACPFRERRTRRRRSAAIHTCRLCKRT